MGKIKKDANPDAKAIKLNHGVSNDEFVRDNILETIGDDINTMCKVFEIFNETLFDGELDTPIIYIDAHIKVEYKVEMPSGWVKIKGDKNETDCIRLFLSEKIYMKELKDIYITLLKAMIVQYDLEMAAVHKAAKNKWIRLVNNNNNYFGKRYKIECEKRGLKIIEAQAEDESTEKNTDKKKDKKIKPQVDAGDRFNEIYTNYGIEDNFKLVHQYVGKKKDDHQVNQQSMRLFKCPGCGIKIRVTKTGDIDIRCFNGSCNGKRLMPDGGER